MTKKCYAAKMIPFEQAPADPRRFLSEAFTEINVLKTVYHENLIRMIDFFMDSNSYQIVLILEYC